ncbi:hypothetical protein D3C84_327270 [compost metagenome]
MNSRGISTAISDRVRETMVKAICREPSRAAASGPSPCSTWRAMFSIMMMASSTTKPVAMVSAIRVRLLMLKPHRYMAAKVPTSESGTAMAGIRVAVRLRRNRKITITTRATASISSNCTSRSAARMFWVRSLSTSRRTPSGRSARSSGRRAWMRSTSSMMLAPGWRWTLTRIAGCSPAQAAWRRSSGASSTLATWSRRTGAPFRQAMMVWRNSPADCNWLLASMLEACSVPSKLPLAWLELAATSTARTLSSPSP